MRDCFLPTQQVRLPGTEIVNGQRKVYYKTYKCLQPVLKASRKGQMFNRGLVQVFIFTGGSDPFDQAEGHSLGYLVCFSMLIPKQEGLGRIPLLLVSSKVIMYIRDIHI